MHPTTLGFPPPVAGEDPDPEPPGAAGEADAPARLFAELGSPIRLRMLRELAAQPRTVTPLGALLGLSAQEVSRHLKRLADLGLVAREASRAYVATPFGKVVAGEVPAFAALLAHRRFFQEHALAALPPGLGAVPLALARHHPGTESRNMERAAALVERAQASVRYGGNQLGWIAGPLARRAEAGVDVEVVLARRAAEGSAAALGRGPGAPGGRALRLRVVERAPAIVGVTEREGFAFLPRAHGGMDFGHLVEGDGPGFLAWCNGFVDALLAEGRGGDGDVQVGTAHERRGPGHAPPA